MVSKNGGSPKSSIYRCIFPYNPCSHWVFPFMESHGKPHPMIDASCPKSLHHTRPRKPSGGRTFYIDPSYIIRPTARNNYDVGPSDVNVVETSPRDYNYKHHKSCYWTYVHQLSYCERGPPHCKACFLCFLRASYLKSKFGCFWLLTQLKSHVL